MNLNLMDMNRECESIYNSFVEVMPYGVKSVKTKKVMEDFQDYMNKKFCVFSVGEFEKLSQLYIKDKSFNSSLNDKKIGLGEFIGQAILYWF